MAFHNQKALFITFKLQRWPIIFCPPPRKFYCGSYYPLVCSSNYEIPCIYCDNFFLWNKTKQIRAINLHLLIAGFLPRRIIQDLVPATEKTSMVMDTVTAANMGMIVTKCVLPTRYRRYLLHVFHCHTKLLLHLTKTCHHHLTIITLWIHQHSRTFLQDTQVLDLLHHPHMATDMAVVSIRHLLHDSMICICRYLIKCIQGFITAVIYMTRMITKMKKNRIQNRNKWF